MWILWLVLYDTRGAKSIIINIAWHTVYILGTGVFVHYQLQHDYIIMQYNILHLPLSQSEMKFIRGSQHSPSQLFECLIYIWQRVIFTENILTKWLQINTNWHITCWFWYHHHSSTSRWGVINWWNHPHGLHTIQLFFPLSDVVRLALGGLYGEHMA